jgi:phosphoglycolate phosphatase-like HAD superfamily hydrolase
MTLLIFDCDGVLVDSELLADAALAELMARSAAVSHLPPPESGLISHSKLPVLRDCLGTVSSALIKSSTASPRPIFTCSQPVRSH